MAGDKELLVSRGPVSVFTANSGLSQHRRMREIALLLAAGDLQLSVCAGAPARGREGGQRGWPCRLQQRVPGPFGDDVGVSLVEPRGAAQPWM